MNFNAFLHHDGDNSSGSGNHLSSAATATMSGGLAKSIFSSPRLSLCLQTNGEATRIGDVSTTRRSPESRSGSDNVEALSGDDDLDASDKPLKKKKRYHRHNPQQIQELESVFKEFPHPDEKQRLDLGRRLNLDSQQVKFWFQNRRTQMKTQIERHENSLLRLENDKLRAENMSVREAMRNPMCSHCGGSTVVPAQISLEEHHLRIENSRLKDELDRICALAGKFLNRSDDATGLHQLPNSSFKLGVGSKNGYAGDCGCGFTLVPPGFENSSPLYSGLAAPVNRTTDFATGLDQKSLYLDLGLSAMAELVKMVQTSEPLWIPSAKDKREMLNREEYEKLFAPCVGPKPDGFVSEASKEVGMVVINSLALVETLMDSERWEEMFPRIIARSSTSEIISSGMGGTRSGALHLMQAELQLLSPLVPVRQVTFLRFCKQHAEGVWAVVDVSLDRISDRGGSALAQTSQSCRRLPSGCLVQDMPNGYSKVTWIDHTEYDESNIHNLYRPLVSSGLAFGSRRWISALQRQCKSLAILMSSTISNHNTPISSIGKKSMLKLAARMTQKFCKGVCNSSSQNWSKLEIGTIDKDVRIMTRKNIDDPGEPPGILLSAATSLWVPVSPRRLFDFLRDELLRSEWDILSNGGRMQEIANIFKGQDHSNSISLLRSTAMNSNQSSMLILQETSIDESEAIVVYAPVDIPAMQSVMNGADSAHVPLLPSGFAILPYGQKMNETGSVLTVAFQILVNSLPTAKLNVESIETFNNLIYCTVKKIRAALGCDK